ncbi:MAG: HD-GYP domain-containing protein [Nitrospiria bacterium]
MVIDQDLLCELDKDITSTEKLTAIHGVLKKKFNFIDRISVAVYDAKTDILKSYSHSSGGKDPLSHYQAKLSDSQSLNDIFKTGSPRVINNLDCLRSYRKEHILRILKQGYRASYTMPMVMNGIFFGFVFFDSNRAHSLGSDVVHDLNLFGHLISLTVINHLMTIQTMLATVKAARSITRFRDMETGTHLDRMSHYARLIARDLAGVYHFSDEFIEHVFLFAPLHDIGKIGVPDAILQKAGRLSESEYAVMKSHAEKGREIIDAILEDFGPESLQQIAIMRNIVESHHEHVDGRGYPHGKQGEAIPIEARIISVADIFDALTSARPYKTAWTNEEAFTELRRISGTQLDEACVEALIGHPREVEAIQKRFKDDLYT